MPTLRLGDRAVTLQAGIEPTAVGEVVMTGQAVDLGMFAMVEVQGQHPCPLQQGFAQYEAGTGRDECAGGEHRGHDGDDDERRMPAEGQPARAGRFSRRRSRAAAAPEEHREAGRRDGHVQYAAAVAAGVPAGGHDMRGEQHCQDAAENDVRCLEVAVTSPKTAACTGERDQDQHQEQKESRNSRQLIKR